MTRPPSKHNDNNQGNSNGNNRDNQDGRDNDSNPPNIARILPIRVPFFLASQERTSHDLTPEERARRSMASIEMALQIIRNSDPTITRNSDRSDDAPDGPSRRTQ